MSAKLGLNSQGTKAQVCGPKQAQGFFNTYYYHTDHLGSAQLVTDYHGDEYEHIEYTPYGELFLEQVRDGLESLPYRFTGKELDPETGLYYY